MFKKYIYMIVIGVVVSALVGGGVYALKSHNQAVSDAFVAGENAAGLVCATEKLAAVAAATAEQERIHAADTEKVLAQLDESRRLAQTYEQRFEDSKRYANALHTQNSQFNYLVGAVRVLNDTVRESAGLPAAPALSDATARAPSAVTGEDLRAWAGQCAKQYGQLSSRYSLLLSLAEERAGARAGSS